MTLSATLRHRLDIQGYACVDDATLAQTQVWLRMSPTLCATIAAVGTALASPGILWGLTIFAALDAMLPFHPFDLIYNLGIRQLTGKRFGSGVRKSAGNKLIWSWSSSSRRGLPPERAGT